MADDKATRAISTTGTMVDLATGEGFSLIDVCASSYQRRFNTVVAPHPLSVACHLQLAGVAGMAYVDRFPDRLCGVDSARFIIACFTHDLHETLLGDTPLSVKRAFGHANINAVEDVALGGILSWMQHAGLMEVMGTAKKAIKDVDRCALLAELAYYLDLWPAHRGFGLALDQSLEKMDKELLEFATSAGGLNIRGGMIVDNAVRVRLTAT